MTIILDAAVLLPMILFYPAVLAMSFDSTFAELRGIRVSVIYLVLLALTACTIVLLLNVVGIILVIALLTLPAATAGAIPGSVGEFKFTVPEELNAPGSILMLFLPFNALNKPTEELFEIPADCDALLPLR